MRAKNKIFHLECFRCVACEKQLIPGEEFALQNDGTLFCKEDTRHILPGCKSVDRNRICASNPKAKSEENNNSHQDNIKREINVQEEDVADDDDLDKGDRTDISNNLRGEGSLDPDDEMMSIKSEDDFLIKNEKCDSSSSSFAKACDGKKIKHDYIFFFEILFFMKLRKLRKLSMITFSSLKFSLFLYKKRKPFSSSPCFA